MIAAVKDIKSRSYCFWSTNVELLMFPFPQFSVRYVSNNSMAGFQAQLDWSPVSLSWKPSVEQWEDVWCLNLWQLDPLTRPSFCSHRRGLHKTEQADWSWTLVQRVPESQAGPHSCSPHVRQTPGYDGKIGFFFFVSPFLKGENVLLLKETKHCFYLLQMKS